MAPKQNQRVRDFLAQRYRNSSDTELENMQTDILSFVEILCQINQRGDNGQLPHN